MRVCLIDAYAVVGQPQIYLSACAIFLLISHFTSATLAPPDTIAYEHLLISISWLHLVFFNGLWVVFPIWILWEAYRAMSSAMSQAEMVDLVNYLKKDD